MGRPRNSLSPECNRQEKDPNEQTEGSLEPPLYVFQFCGVLLRLAAECGKSFAMVEFLPQQDRRSGIWWCQRQVLIAKW